MIGVTNALAAVAAIATFRYAPGRTVPGCDVRSLGGRVTFTFGASGMSPVLGTAGNLPVSLSSFSLRPAFSLRSAIAIPIGLAAAAELAATRRTSREARG